MRHQLLVPLMNHQNPKLEESLRCSQESWSSNAALELAYGRRSRCIPLDMACHFLPVENSGHNPEFGYTESLVHGDFAPVAQM
jgi:hypothetical protein